MHDNWTPSLTVVWKIGKKFDIKTRLVSLIYNFICIQKTIKPAAIF